VEAFRPASLRRRPGPPAAPGRSCRRLRSRPQARLLKPGRVRSSGVRPNPPSEPRWRSLGGGQRGVFATGAERAMIKPAPGFATRTRRIHVMRGGPHRTAPARSHELQSRYPRLVAPPNPQPSRQQTKAPSQRALTRTDAFVRFAADAQTQAGECRDVCQSLGHAIACPPRAGRQKSPSRWARGPCWLVARRVWALVYGF
jgi:hypothetical protein